MNHNPQALFGRDGFIRIREDVYGLEHSDGPGRQTGHTEGGSHESPLQAGTSSVEFALVSFLLCAGLFGCMELCRIFWVWNSAAEVTARAARLASVLPFGATAQIGREAVLQAGSTQSTLSFPGISEITNQSVQVQYMTGPWGALTPTTTYPADGVQNLSNCIQGLNPCVSAVQVSLCQAGTMPCEPLNYQSLWISLWGLTLQIPSFTVTVPLQGAGATQA